MSSSSPLLCLFCNHLNPGSASFCNECGSQLHLQQCDLCGSINKRTARTCYKCGATFTFSAAHGLNLAILENRLEFPSLNHAGGANEFTTLPESAAQAFRVPHQKFWTADSEPIGDAVEVEARKTIPQNHLLMHSPAEPPPADETVSSEWDASATGARYLYPITVSVIAFIAIVMSLYYYHEHSKQRSWPPGVEQVSPGESGDLFFSDTTPPVLAAQVKATSAQNGTMKKFSFSVFGFDAEASPARSTPGAASRPSSAADADADAEVHQDRPMLKECQEAVAALGLCSSMPIKERP
jgi:hypothetical protein